MSIISIEINKKMPFLITIDTEGDNLWSNNGNNITTNNALYLPRFQALCEKYGFKPTYLTNYEMAISPDFIKMASKAKRLGTCEVGMHLHSWNSPPIYPLTHDDYKCCPYLIDFSQEIMEEKIAFMTKLLQDTFEGKVYSHRAGRWAMDERYMSLLEKYEYEIDCSVTPGISWEKILGDPNGNGGSDYRNSPLNAYHPNHKNISEVGNMNILELPTTIVRRPIYESWICKSILNAPFKRLSRKIAPYLLGEEYLWLRPNGNNLNDMLNVLRYSKSNNFEYFQFMLHSSEFMPGGSPKFATTESIELLYKNLDTLFGIMSNECVGMTLKEYKDTYIS